jgi:alpha-tubulin suppressor-like RCC1 family protein
MNCAEATSLSAIRPDPGIYWGEYDSAFIGCFTKEHRTLLDNHSYLHELKAQEDGLADTVDGTKISTWIMGGESGNEITSVGAYGSHAKTHVDMEKIYFAINPELDCNTFGNDIHKQPFIKSPVSYSEPPLRAIAISSGPATSCAVLQDGTPRCWGSNHQGAVGTDHGSQVATIRLGNVVSVVPFGLANCALLRDGKVYCWGAGLGTGDHPRQLLGTTAIASLSSNGGQLCALLKTSAVACTDRNNRFTRKSGLSNVVAVSAGSAHACAVKNSGLVFCWGYLSNFSMESRHNPLLEDGIKHKRPVEIPEIRNAIGVDATGSQDCALLRDGTIKCWSYSGKPEAPVEKPTIVKMPPAKLISTSCAILRNGRVSCWAKEAYKVGQIYFEKPPLDTTSNGSPSPGPIMIESVSGATAISLAADHGCALAGTGTVLCWGDNSWGQLGSLAHWNVFSNLNPKQQYIAYPVLGF